MCLEGVTDDKLPASTHLCLHGSSSLPHVSAREFQFTSSGTNCCDIAIFLVHVVQGVRESWDQTWTLAGVGMMETGAASSLRYGMSSVTMTRVHSVLVFAVARWCIILFVTEGITDDSNKTLIVS